MTTTIKLEVSKTVNKNGTNVREKVGDVTIFCPTLKDFGLDVEPTGQNEDGEMVYASIAHQWLYNAIVQGTKAAARNKLQSGSVELKPNNKIAANLEELVTPSETGSTILAERRALLTLFKDYLANLAKPENVKRVLYTFLEKPETLVVQPAEQRAKIKGYFEEFGGAVEASLTQWQADYLLNVIAQCDEADIEF